MPDYFDLYDYRCRVLSMYQERNRALLHGDDAADVLQHFRAQRDDLFAHHPQSAFDEEQRRSFSGLHYFPYNPALRVVIDIDKDVEPIRHTVAMNATETMSMTTVGRIHFVVADEPVALSLYWLDIYGGGLFLPFRDATCPTQSYGGGRYLLDTIKGSDFQMASTTPGEQRVVLDFNYAYNPSCAYNYRWFCPLAPIENRLAVSISAGEMNYVDRLPLEGSGSAEETASSADARS